MGSHVLCRGSCHQIFARSPPSPGNRYRSIGDHTEAVQIEYDPSVLPFEGVVEKFFQQHNWSSPCRGSRQYRTAIWYANAEQREAIERHVAKLEASNDGARKVATAVEPLGEFYRAEEYHQKYMMR